MVRHAVGERRWYRGWNIVIVCALSGVGANALPVNAFSLFLRGWSADFGVPISSLVLGLTLGGAGCALLGPVFGFLADRYSPKRLMTVGLVSVVAFALGMSFATTLWQYLVLFALLMPPSLCLSAQLVANTIVSRWFVRRRGLALAITSIGLAMGGIVMPVVIAYAMPVIGWRGVWRATGLFVALVILPLLLLIVRDRPDDRDGDHYLTGSADGGPSLHGAHGGKSTLGFRDIVGNRNFWLLIVGYVPMLGTYGVCLQNIAPIVAERGLSDQTAGLLLALQSAAQLGATLLAGLLSDRFGSRVPMVLLAMTTALGAAIVAVAGNTLTFGLGIVLTGFGAAFWPAIVATLVREFGAGGVGRAFGLLSFFLPFTSLIPFAVARIKEATGSYTPALLTLTVLTILGGLACLMLRRREDPPVAGERDGAPLSAT